MYTKKLYDIDTYKTSFTAKVLSCKEVEKNSYAVVLDQTAFFPEEGGQTPDKGTLGEATVLDVQIHGKEIVHYTDKPLAEGQEVRGQIDWQHRFFNMQQHSGEHIFSGLAYRKYGYQNVGFHLSNQIVTMDFDGVFTYAQLEEMEWEVNEAIAANVEIKTGYPSSAELEQLEYRSKIDIKEDVRIVEVVGYDTCACCAPHVHLTGEIGMFKIQSAQNYKGGMRISFLCGFRALAEYRKKAQILTELTGLLTTNQENLPEHVEKLKNQIQGLKTELAQTGAQLMEYKIAGLPEEETDVILFEKDLDNKVARNTVNKLMKKHEGICGIFIGNEKEGYSFIIGSKTVDCKEIATKLREELGARGGGGSQMIQGSVVASKEKIILLFSHKVKASEYK